VPYQINDMTSTAPGAVGILRRVCVMNTGARPTRLSFQVTDMQSLESNCTGDEPIVDPTCGNGQAGELQQTLGFVVTPQDMSCRDGFIVGAGSGATAPGNDGTLGTLDNGPQPLGLQLKPNEVTCLQMSLQTLDFDEDLLQASQSDYVGFNIKFATTTEGVTP
jgi:hypothetical protein